MLDPRVAPSVGILVTFSSRGVPERSLRSSSPCAHRHWLACVFAPALGARVVGWPRWAARAVLRRAPGRHPCVIRRA